MTDTRFAIITRVVVAVATLGVLGVLFGYAFTIATLHLSALAFNTFGLVSGLTALLELGLMAYLVSKPTRTEEIKWLMLYVASLFMYTAVGMLQQLSQFPQAALFWGVVSSVIVVGSPAIYMFALSYTNQSERRYPGTSVLLISAALLLMFFATYTNIIYVNDIKYAVKEVWGYDFRTAIGPAGLLIVAFYYVLFISAISRMIHFRRHTRNKVLRTQSFFFILAMCISIVGISVVDVLLPSVGLANLPPFDALLGAPVAFLLVYGLVKYRVLTVSPTLFSNTILAIMQEAVVVTDKDFNIVFTNTKAESMLGMKAERKAAPKLLELIDHGSLATFQQAFADVVAQDDSITLDHIDISPAHADKVPVRVISSRLKVGDYETRVMILSDITQELHTRGIIEHEVQVRTEQLNRARTYLESSINSLEQGFILVNQKADVELLNGVASRLCTVKSADAPGKHLTEIVKALPWDISLASAVDKVLESKHHKRVDVVATDGSFFEVFVTPVISSDDRELGATVIIQDVTERKILDRSKDEFFSIASHELRTPLTAIRGNMSMVKDYFPDAMKDESLSAMIDDTHDASVRLIEIVSDFLDSSTLEQGKMQFTIQPVVIKPVLEAVEGDLKTLLEQSHDTVNLSGLDKLPKVAADEGRLRQIFYNLLSNALKYSENATITITGDADEHKVRIHVADTGKGISPENQKLLFHKFQQAGDSILTRDNTKGTGLGLYISRLLATNMHGNVELEHTEEGKGSTFVVTLPIAEKKNERL